MTTSPAGPADAPAPTSVAVLGLGAMGAALARALLAAGHPTTVWNRSPGRTEPLAVAGASVAATPAAAARAAELVVVCVLDQAASAAVTEAAGDALAGRTLADVTNGTPADARGNAERAARYGAAYLDGAMMAGPQQLGTPTATLLFSGSERAYAEHAGTLGDLGTARFLGAEPGAAARLDLALLSAMYGMVGGYVHGLALLGDDVTATAFADDVVPWLGSMLPALPRLARQVDAGEYATEVSTLDVHAAALDNVLAASEQGGFDPALLRPVAALLAHGTAAGHGRDSFARLVPLLRSIPPTRTS